MQIRNSTVDFLVFTKDAHEDGIEVRVQDHDVWLTQKAIGQLFDVDRSVVTKHLKNIYESGELYEDSTCANFAQVADNGKTYQYKFYSLPAIIAVGYRINSDRATQFRQYRRRRYCGKSRPYHTKDHMELLPSGRNRHYVFGLCHKTGPTTYPHDNGRLGIQTGCFSAIQRCGDFTR